MAKGNRSIDDAYTHHVGWAQENGHDPDSVNALKAHENAKGINRREANGIADLQGIGGGGTDWRSQGHDVSGPDYATPEEAAQATAANRHPFDVLMERQQARHEQARRGGIPATEGSVSRHVSSEVTDHRGRML